MTEKETFLLMLCLDFSAYIDIAQQELEVQNIVLAAVKMSLS